MRAIEILNGLDEHLDCPVIIADQAAPRTPYPYIAIKEIVSFIPASYHPSVTDRDLEEIDIERTATSQPTMSLSVTAYSNDMKDVSELIQEAHDWFSFNGYRALKEKGYVVADIQSIMNRDSLIVDDYERRRGFDVILRFVHTQSRIVREIKVVKGKVNEENFISRRSDMN